MAKSRVLRLTVRGIPANEHVVTHQTSILYTIGDIQGEVLSSADYRNTNSFLNSLYQSGSLGKDWEACFTFQRRGLWSFVPSFIWPNLFRTIELIDLLNPLLDQFTPEEVVANVPDDRYGHLWVSLLKEVGRDRRFVVRFEQRFRTAEFGRRGFNFVRQQGGLGLLKIIRRALRFLKRHRLHLGSDYYEKIGLVTLGTRHWVTVPGDPEKRHDEQFELIRQEIEIREKKGAFFIDCQETPTRDLESRIESSGQWIRFADLARWSDLRSIRDWIRFRKNWRKFTSSPDVRRRFTYRGVSLLSVFSVEVSWVFFEILPEAAEYIRTARRFLSETHPQALILTYETGPWQRSLLVEADHLGIPTLALQHGMIFSNHYDCMHSQLTMTPSALPHHFAIPKKLCVWGNFWKDVLVRAGSYPDSAVQVTGSWKIGHALASDVRKKGSKIPSAVEPHVLILSGGQNPVRFVEESIQALIKIGLSDFSIKLHPLDDLEAVGRVLEEHGVLVDRIKKDQLFEHMQRSILIIGQGSTTIAEALLMDKDVVLVNPENLELPAWYGSSGSVAYVTKYADLASTISRVLNDESTRQELMENRATLVNSLFVRTGQSAAEAVVSELKKLMDAIT